MSRPARLRIVASLVCIVGLAIAAAPAHAALVPASIVVAEGTIPSGSPRVVADLNRPFATNGPAVAFTGRLNDGNAYVYLGDSIVWLESEQAGVQLESIQSDMGANVDGEFVLELSINGEPGLWTQDGALAVGGDPAPGFDFFPQASFTYLRSPSMNAAGDVYFYAQVDLTADDSADVGGLFRAPASDPDALELVIGSADMVGGVQLAGDASALTRTFAVSSTGDHLIGLMLAASDSGTDSLVVVDGAPVAREGSSIVGLPPADNWSGFRDVAINAAGSHLFSGDSSGSSSSDDFIAYNGAIVLREGATVDGSTIRNNAMYIGLNDYEHAAFVFQSTAAGNPPVAYFACDAGDITGTAERILSIGDQLDLDGDGDGEFTVATIPSSGNGDLSKILGNDLGVYLLVTLSPGDIEAIVRVPVTCCGNGTVDGNESCEDGNDDDTDACPSSCVTAFCGDGFVLADVETCDDGNASDTDACPSTCVPAFCGDGFVLAGTEACDDGNEVDDDACANDCTVTGGGSSSDSGGNETESSSSEDGGSTGDTSGSSDSGVDASTGTTGDDAGSSDEGSTGSTGDDPSSSSTAEGSDGSSSSEGSTSSGESNSDASSSTGDDGSLTEGEDDGCDCRTSADRPAPWWLGLVLLGCTRRRRAYR